jgi:hypothetical protein
MPNPNAARLILFPTLNDLNGWTSLSPFSLLSVCRVHKAKPRTFAPKFCSMSDPWFIAGAKSQAKLTITSSHS